MLAAVAVCTAPAASSRTQLINQVRRSIYMPLDSGGQKAWQLSNGCQPRIRCSALGTEAEALGFVAQMGESVEWMDGTEH